MSPRVWLPRIAVAVGYVCVAVAFSWPLPLHLGTSLTGPPGGDTGVYIWNQWVFQHEALEHGTNPLRTDKILSLTDRVDLSQHNYTVFLNLLALPLMPWLGVVATFNLVWLAAMVLTALSTYLLARRTTPAGRAEAWLAGLAFAWSAALVARTTGHFSLVCAAPLPIFLLFLLRADRTRLTSDAVMAGLAVAWAALCDPYYAVYCAIIAGGYVVGRFVRVSVAATAVAAPWRWAVNLLIVVTAGLIVGLIATGGGRFSLLGLAVSMRGLYTPVFVLTLLVLVRLALALRPRLAFMSPMLSTTAVRVLLAGVLACAAPLSPVLYGLGARIADGRFVNPPTLWRSSPRGVDLAGLFEFNPNHPLARLFLDRQAANSAVFVEFAAALSLVSLIVVGVAVWRVGYRPASGWLWLTIGFAALSLGPFVHVMGVNTHVPGPWALLRYVPMLATARMPTRFAIVAALGLAILLAGALAALSRQAPQRRRQLVAIVGALLVFELFPAPRTLYSAAVPAFYDTVAADPRDVRVLHLPFGLRDGTFVEGDFSAEYLFHQTHHGKRLVGGYLSRISRKRVTATRAQPTLDALVIMSQGHELSPGHAAAIKARGARFIRRADVGYVVVNESRTPPHLLAFAIDAWQLTLIGRDRGFALYRPRLE